MTHDATIQKRVLDELEWAPLVDARHIGVAVREGIVELIGHVETFAAKLQAERVARPERRERRRAGDLRPAPQP